MRVTVPRLSKLSHYQSAGTRCRTYDRLHILYHLAFPLIRRQRRLNSIAEVGLNWQVGVILPFTRRQLLVLVAEGSYNFREVIIGIWLSWKLNMRRRSYPSSLDSSIRKLFWHSSPCRTDSKDWVSSRNWPLLWPYLLPGIAPVQNGCCLSSSMPQCLSNRLQREYSIWLWVSQWTLHIPHEPSCQQSNPPLSRWNRFRTALWRYVYVEQEPWTSIWWRTSGWWSGKRRKSKRRVPYIRGSTMVLTARILAFYILA